MINHLKDDAGNTLAENLIALAILSACVILLLTLFSVTLAGHAKAEAVLREGVELNAIVDEIVNETKKSISEEQLQQTVTSVLSNYENWEGSLSGGADHLFTLQLIHTNTAGAQETYYAKIFLPPPQE